MTISRLDGNLAKQSFCYVTTIGRRSGKEHEIEIWFAARDRTIYLLSGGGAKADWVKNLQAHPDVQVRIDKSRFEGTARVVDDPDEESWARAALLEKYQSGYGGDLTKWSQSALPVAIDLR